MRCSRIVFSALAALFVSPVAAAREPFDERGVYCATHFSNWYEEASDEDVARYVEELAEWGMNGVGVWCVPACAR